MDIHVRECRMAEESLIICVNRFPECLVMIGSECAVETYENRRT